MRKPAFLLTLVVGIALAGAGFFLSAPWGPTSDPIYSDPRLPFAPLVFVAGVITIVLAPVVYELIPDKAEGKKKRD